MPYVGEVEPNETEWFLLTAEANPRNNSTRYSFTYVVPRRSAEDTSRNRAIEGSSSARRSTENI